jgi:hypothetical protein
MTSLHIRNIKRMHNSGRERSGFVTRKAVIFSSAINAIGSKEFRISLYIYEALSN